MNHSIYKTFQPTDSNDAVFWAKKYIQQGFSPIPVHHKTKLPVQSGWPSSQILEEEADEIFGGRLYNIGIVLGSASGGLIDVDIDGVDALALAPHFLPPTNMIFGRASKPNSHWVYRTGDDLRHCTFRDAVGGMLVEIRGDGHQTVFPPSIHVSDEAVQFSNDGTPFVVELDYLVMAVSHLAFATLLSRNWKEGQRHDLALATASVLAQLRCHQSEVTRLIEAVASHCNDQELEDRIECVQSTFKKQSSNVPIAGHSQLALLLGEPTSKKLKEFASYGTKNSCSET